MILFLNRLITESRLNHALAHLAAIRENLREAEEDYNAYYPTDRSVERVLLLRKRSKEYQQKVVALQMKIAGIVAREQLGKSQ